MARKSRKNVGIIGLGIIGSRIAGVLRDAGYQVYVWSRTPHVEPNFMGSPAEIAEICDVIQIFVSNADAVFETIERLSGSLTERHVVVCNATIGPEATIEAARRVHEQGAQFVDAPFSGSLEAAEKAQLLYLVGGDEAVLKRIEPVLQASSKAIVRIGDIGQAATVKIATNMMVAVTVQTLAEAMAVVKRHGVDPQVFAEAMANHGVQSGVSAMKLPKMLGRDFEPHFSLKHMFKDVQLAIHMANAEGLDIPATTATAGVIYGGLNRGWGEQDIAILNEVYADPAAVVEDTAAPVEVQAAPPPSEPEGAPIEIREAQPTAGLTEIEETQAPPETEVENEPAAASVEETQGPVDLPESGPEPIPEAGGNEPARVEAKEAPGVKEAGERKEEVKVEEPKQIEEAPKLKEEAPKGGGIFRILFGGRS